MYVMGTEGAAGPGSVPLLVLMALCVIGGVGFGLTLAFAPGQARWRACLLAGLGTVTVVSSLAAALAVIVGGGLGSAIATIGGAGCALLAAATFHGMFQRTLLVLGEAPLALRLWVGLQSFVLSALAFKVVLLDRVGPEGVALWNTAQGRAVEVLWHTARNRIAGVELVLTGALLWLLWLKYVRGAQSGQGSQSGQGPRPYGSIPGRSSSA